MQRQFTNSIPSQSLSRHGALIRWLGFIHASNDSMPTLKAPRIMLHYSSSTVIAPQRYLISSTPHQFPPQKKTIPSLGERFQQQNTRRVRQRTRISTYHLSGPGTRCTIYLVNRLLESRLENQARWRKEDYKARARKASPAVSPTQLQVLIRT